MHTKVATQKNWKEEVPAISAYVTEISTNNFAQGLYGLSGYCLYPSLMSENSIFG